MKLINNGSLTSGLLVCTKGKVAARALFKSRKEMKFGSCNYHAEPKTTAVANRKEGAAAMVTTPGRPNNEQNHTQASRYSHQFRSLHEEENTAARTEQGSNNKADRINVGEGQ